MKKRKVLIDLRFLKNPTNGFGQLSLDYGKYFLENPEKYEDLDITLLVPKQYIGKFGENVHYLEVSSKHKLFPFLYPHFDVVHSTTQLMKFVPLSSNTHRIMTIHDIYYLYETNSKKVESKKNRLNARLKLSDTVTAVSKHTLNDVHNFLKVENKDISVNYVGIPDISKDDEKKPSCIENGHRKFLFTIGQFVPRKNFHVLLDAMKLMPEYNLYICGNDDFEYGSLIKEQIKKENITNVIIPGKIAAEEKVWFYKHCEAFIFPSVFEGFGIPVIDAMRFKKPIISSRLTSLSEVGSIYPFYLDNFEPEHIQSVVKQAITTFYEDEDFQNRQNEYALTFSLDKHMEYYFNLYRSIDLNTKKSFVKTIKNYIDYLGI